MSTQSEGTGLGELLDLWSAIDRRVSFVGRLKWNCRDKVPLGEFTLSLTVEMVCEMGWRKRAVRRVLDNPDANP